MSFEWWQRLGKVDRVVAVGAAVVFVSGFMPWWGYSGPLDLYSASISGWSAGFTAWAGILLLTLAGAFHVARATGRGAGMPELPVGPAVAVAGAAAAGLLLVLIRWMTLPSVHGGAAGSIGPRFGLWIAVVAGAVELGAAVSALRASGEPLPWAQPGRPEQP